MSKCSQVKNPCKICLGAVTQKTGLQCQGACRCWVHYSCLNYTPGKIKDIKAGFIKVTCPCPDCKTTLPKEYRTDQPYSCTNSICPANQPPKCDNNKCPVNTDQPMRPAVPPYPLSKCGTNCKQYSSPYLPDGNPPGQFPQPQPFRPPDHFAGATSSDACLSRITRCNSGCSSTNNISGDYKFNQRGVGIVGPMPSVDVIEQMCNTVGELSNQLKVLMNQMKQREYNNGNRGSRSPPPDQKQKTCPKPCYCPRNPGRRK